MLTLILQKLRKVRLSIPAMVLLVLASYRTLTSGDSNEETSAPYRAAVDGINCISPLAPTQDLAFGLKRDS